MHQHTQRAFLLPFFLNEPASISLRFRVKLEEARAHGPTSTDALDPSAVRLLVLLGRVTYIVDSCFVFTHVGIVLLASELSFFVLMALAVRSHFLEIFDGCLDLFEAILGY